MKRLRPYLVFAGTFAVGLGVLFLLGGGKTTPGRPGIRVEVVKRSDGTIPALAPFLEPGMPKVHELEGPEYFVYGEGELPGEGGGTEKVSYPAFHLRADRVYEYAENVTLELFPRPTSLAEAEAFREKAPEPRVTIRAKQAEPERFYETDASDRVDERWRVQLLGGVTIRTRQEGHEASLDADELAVDATGRKVSSGGKVLIRAEQFEVEGVGLEGAAGLGTFRVEKDVVVTLPTALLLSEAAADAGSVTRVTCGGPLLVESLGPPEGREDWIGTRVTFENSVEVRQNPDAPGPKDRLAADELVLRLEVHRPEGGGTSAKEVRLLWLRATGEVELARGAGTRVTAEQVRIWREDDEDRFELIGPATVRHEEAVEPLADGTGPEPTLLLVDAAGTGLFVRPAEGKGATFRFTDGVRIRRVRKEDESLLLELAAENLELALDAGGGRKMIAHGDARFAVSGATGRADRIVWTSPDPTTTDLTLSGSPRVDAEGTAGFGALGAGPPPPDAPDAGEEPRVVRFTANGSMRLVEKGEGRDLRLDDEARVVQIVDGREETDVRADSIHAVLRGKAIEQVVAEGSVVAVGRPEVEGAGRRNVRATGDSFRFEESSGVAVLAGRPARAVIDEPRGGRNEIEASRISFRATGERRLVAEDDVHATVYLAETPDAAPQPFSLRCGRLEVVPVPEGTAEADSSPENRIASFVAAGAVALEGEDWVAHGSRLIYGREGGRRVELVGEPARMTRTRTLAGKEYEDSFEAPELRASLVGKRLMAFDSPVGGKVVVFRPWGRSGPAVLGDAPKKDSGRSVERFSAGATGSISYHGKTGLIRFVKEATVEQAAGDGEDFEVVASFTADEIRAWIRSDADGEDELVRAEGRDNVTGHGEDWQLECRAFEIDLVNTRTIVSGSPARVKTGGRELVVTHAVYDYERKQWSEVFEGGGGR